MHCIPGNGIVGQWIDRWQLVTRLVLVIVRLHKDCQMCAMGSVRELQLVAVRLNLWRGGTYTAERQCDNEEGFGVDHFGDVANFTFWVLN